MATKADKQFCSPNSAMQTRTSPRVFSLMAAVFSLLLLFPLKLAAQGFGTTMAAPMGQLPQMAIGQEFGPDGQIINNPDSDDSSDDSNDSNASSDDNDNNSDDNADNGNNNDDNSSDDNNSNDMQSGSNDNSQQPDSN